jgi:UDP-N-acetylmuramoyl-L-alanyl-D-glutamate--2,6-diaminopimelate ligase
MLLSSLQQAVSRGTLVGSSDPEILDITQNSTAIESGWMFACVTGETSDGHEFAQSAVDSGAVALLVERSVSAGVPELLVDDTRAALAPIAAQLHGEPSQHMRIVGVTGTSGKTTVTMLLGQLLGMLGASSEVLGTLSGARTTPESPILQRRLRTWLDEGIDFVAMEVSSHALIQRRVDAIAFDVVVFLNLSAEHLDYHSTMGEYFAAKSALFVEHDAAHRLVCVDDEWGQRLASQLGSNATTFGLHQLDNIESTDTGTRFVWRGETTAVTMPGRFNVSNAQAAAETALLLGYEASQIGRLLPLLSPVPGRLEPVEEGQDFSVIVDYAHKPAALDLVLREARTMTHGRVIVVLGCGGDRDAQKRPEMGRIAAELADMTYVTSDNPRKESPEAIISEIIGGIPSGRQSSVQIVVERAAAIREALHNAAGDDVVVIAGKGHETTQTFADRVVEFDDREVARLILREQLEDTL